MESNTACVLILDLPKASFCGIDLLSFTTSPRFLGIKSIPKGWHLLFTGTSSTFSIRHGIWFEVRGADGPGPEVLVLKWSKDTESLVEETEEVAILSWRANLGSIWREGLTPYRQSVPDDARDNAEEYSVENTTAWPKLTSLISRSLLTRVTQAAGVGICTLSSASSAARDVDDIPGLTEAESLITGEKELRFLPIDLRQTWREGALGRERSEAAQDRSWALENLIQKHCQHPLDVLGELQLTFINVLTLNNYSCLEQWKRILSLLLTCRLAVVKQSSFFAKFFHLLRLQLENCAAAEGGLFDLSEDGATLLKTLIRRFRQGLEQLSGGQGKVDVSNGLAKIEDYLETQHGFIMNDAHVKRGNLQLEDGEVVQMELNGQDEEDESGEFAPTIVDLTPEQATRLGISPANGPAKERSLLRDEEELTESDQEDGVY